MNINELLQRDFSGKNILIIGCAASGKTYLSKLLTAPNPGHELLHTDDFQHLGFEESMYAVLDKIQSSANNTIVEGVQGYRLLRKGTQQDNYYPDVVIEVSITEERLAATYNGERGADKLKGVRSLIKSSATVLASYIAIQNPDRKPEWITVDNDY